MPAHYQHSMLLRNIPENKLLSFKDKIINSCTKCSKVGFESCDKCHLYSMLYDRYYEANIPVAYWDKDISCWIGDNNIRKLYEEILLDVDSFLNSGTSFFLKGQHGVGKTLFSLLLLKKIVEKGFGGLYSTLGDIVSIITGSNYEERLCASKELKMADLLIIDEFDSRFFCTDNSAELYGRVLESIIRIRFQNELSTILITNNPDPTKNLGALGAALDSLLTGYCRQVLVLGGDFRKIKRV